MEQNDLKFWADNYSRNYANLNLCSADILNIWQEFLHIFTTQKEKVIQTQEIQQHDWYLYDGLYGNFTEEFEADCCSRGLRPHFLEPDMQGHEIYFEIISDTDYKKFVDSVVNKKYDSNTVELDKPKVHKKIQNPVKVTLNSLFGALGMQMKYS